MILMTGATGTLGAPLLSRLLGAGEQVRCLVREPRRLGPNRVQVQISIGDLAGRGDFDRAMRGVDTVIHLASTTRDQLLGTIEQVTGVGTLRLLAAAERAGVRRFVQLAPAGGSQLWAGRVMRARAMAAQAVRSSSLETVTFDSSLIYTADDPFIERIASLAHLPVMPLIGPGDARFQPIWAEDAADAITAVLLKGYATPGAPIALVGPESLSRDQIVRLVQRHHGRRRPLLHLPQRPMKRLLDLQERQFGQAAPATWDQIAMQLESVLSPAGTRDLSVVGVTPLPMADVMPAR